MAVVGIAALRPDTGDGTFEWGKYVLRQKYLVITNNLLDDATIVVNAPGLPSLGQVYSDAWPTLRARKYSPRRVGPANLAWEVDVEWSTPERKDKDGTGTDKDQQFTDPTQELPEASFDVTDREEVISEIIDPDTGATRPPTTSNGEVVDPPLKKLRASMTLEISRNEQIAGPDGTPIHPGLGLQYEDAVNADEFWGQPAGTWKCKKIVAKRVAAQLKGGLTAIYLKVSYSFEGKDTWNIVQLDYGTYYLIPNPAGNNLPALQKKFMTAEGHPTAGPLNGQGGPLIRNQPCTFSGNVVTIGGSSGLTVPDGQIVQFNALGAGALPSELEPGTAYYVINSGLSGPATFELSDEEDGAFIAFGDGTAPTYVSQPAVYITYQPYDWLPYADLGLPNSFADVQ